MLQFMDAPNSIRVGGRTSLFVGSKYIESPHKRTAYWNGTHAVFVSIVSVLYLALSRILCKTLISELNQRRASYSRGTGSPGVGTTL